MSQSISKQTVVKTWLLHNMQNKSVIVNIVTVTSDVISHSNVCCVVRKIQSVKPFHAKKNPDPAMRRLHILRHLGSSSTPGPLPHLDNLLYPRFITSGSHQP